MKSLVKILFGKDKKFLNFICSLKLFFKKFFSLKLLYSKFPSVRNGVGETWISRLPFKLFGWNFVKILFTNECPKDNWIGLFDWFIKGHTYVYVFIFSFSFYGNLPKKSENSGFFRDLLKKPQIPDSHFSPNINT